MATTLAAIVLLALAGCNLTITNLTPSTVAQNPSNIYTLTASFVPKTSNVDPGTIQPRVIIDGQSYNMTRSSAAPNVWEFDYQLAPGRTGATYYYICEYAVKSGDRASPQETYTELQSISVNSRYVLRAEATRAPVGARVNIVGAGFSAQDIVYFGTLPARTVYESPASLSFFVPSLVPGTSYQLKVSGPRGDLAAGTFRVDGTDIQVLPTELSLQPGGTASLTFTVPSPAPVGGILIEVTTDVPESVVMPEVVVPAGETSVTVNVQGGKPGSGALYYKTAAGEASIAVTVAGK